MRKKDPVVKERIFNFVNNWRRDNSSSPPLSIIADAIGIDKSTVYRYLVEMTEENYGLTYSGTTIETKAVNRQNLRMTNIPVLGSIACGEAMLEEQNIEDYINFPEDLVRKGQYFALHAVGDSMVDAGIFEGDIVIVRQQNEAQVGQIVVALDDDYQNTLKRFGGLGKDHMIRLEYMNERKYPGKVIKVRNLQVQGVAVHVFRNL